MPRTGFCSHTECDLDIKELYECHCCDKLICLKHLLQHIETSKQNKKALKDLSTITNTFQLIINEKLRQIDCENQLIKQAKELLHSEKCSTDELKSIFDKITLAIQSNHSGDELSVSSLKDETFSVDPLQSTLISSAFMDSTANTNNEESVSADQTSIDIVPLINTMDSAKDEKGKQRGAYSVYQRCPLTFDGAFGLNRREHSLNVCPETNMRKIGLYSHFLCIHKLKRDCTRRLVEAIRNKKDAKTTNLFNANEDVINHFNKVTCPFNDDTMNLFEYDKQKILRVPCTRNSLSFHELMRHLTKRHNLSNKIARNVFDHFEKLREQSGGH